MNNIRTLLGELTNADGVQGAVVVSRDGFVIDTVTRRGDFDSEAAGAMVSAHLGTVDGLTAELRLGLLQHFTLECQEGLLMVSTIGTGAAVAVLADGRASVGQLRFQIRKRLPDFEREL